MVEVVLNVGRCGRRGSSTDASMLSDIFLYFKKLTEQKVGERKRE